MNNIRRQFGLSLVEILVSLVISLFLLGGIVQVYLGNQTTFRFSNGLSEVQENGRFALDTISQDLRHVGDWGCYGYDPDDSVADRQDFVNDTLVGMAGHVDELHDFIGEPAIEGTDNQPVSLNNSDTLTIRGSKPGQVNVISPFTDPATRTLNTAPMRTIAANDIILITRCGTNEGRPVFEADLFRVQSVLRAPGDPLLITSDEVLSQTYQNDATVRELQTVVYSVQNNDDGEPSLFRSEFGNNEELIEGVENMQILYGIDNSNDGYPNRYVPSNNINNSPVVSVRIMLLVRSSDDFVTESPQIVPFNGALDVNPGDRRLRQVFSTTIALRNRIGVS